jgi:hypothetical protein
MPGPDRFSEIVQRWRLLSELPREAPEGIDDIVWLIGEVYRLRKELEGKDDG